MKSTNGFTVLIGPDIRLSSVHSYWMNKAALPAPALSVCEPFSWTTKIKVAFLQRFSRRNQTARTNDDVIFNGDAIKKY